jgi:hypothetical protein
MNIRIYRLLLDVFMAEGQREHNPNKVADSSLTAFWLSAPLLAFTYFFVIYRMFRGKVSLDGGGYEH